MSTGECTIEEIPSVPTGYYLASWNYNTEAIFPRFNKCGVDEKDWISKDATIYIDGVATTVKWEGNESYYYFRLDYSKLNANSLSDLGAHTIKVPKGTKVGSMTLAKDYYIKTVQQGDRNVLVEDKAYMSFASYQDSNNKRYLIYIKATDQTKVLEDVSNVTTPVNINGVNQEVTWSNGTNSYYFAVPYSMTKISNAIRNREVSTFTYVTVPAGTTVGNLTIPNDIHIKITGGGITTEEYRIEEVEALPVGYYYGMWTYNNTSMFPYFYSFTGKEVSFSSESGTIYIDNVAKNVTWKGNGTYFYFELPYTELGGSDRTDIGEHGIIIPKGNPIGEMTFSENIYLKTVQKGATYILMPTDSQETRVTLTNDTINGAEDLTYISVNATLDDLANGTYTSGQFTEGGIYKNEELLTTATLEKKYNGYYWIHLNTTVSAGEIISLDGVLKVDGKPFVRYEPISFIRNKNGSFSLYDANAEAIQAKTMNLKKLYVNLDKWSSYTIPNTPLAKNCDVTVKVNEAETSEVTLTKPGTYQTERVMGNIELARAVSTVENITYKQEVCLFKTGDVNLDGKVAAADIVRARRYSQSAESGIGGASDLDYNNTCTDADYDLLTQFLVGSKTANDILANDQSVVIGAISDMHYGEIDGRDAQNRINTRKALNYYKSQNVDVIIFNGDITDLGKETEYANLKADINAVYPDEATRPTMIFTGDNHEWYDSWPNKGGTLEATQQRFVSQLAELRSVSIDTNTQTNTHETVGGYHFTGVSSDGMDNNARAIYSAATISWVAEQLAAAAAGDNTGKKPIFLAIHQAPQNTVIFSDGADHYSSEKMDTLLKRYPQLVVITSHTHAPLQDERSIHQGDFTTLNTAATSYAGGMSRYGNIKDSLMTEKRQFGQCLLIRAKGNQVEVERVDVYNDEIIKNNWTFETSNNASDYTKYTSARADGNQSPIFADGSEVSVKLSADRKTATLTFPAATDADDLYVDHYLVKVYKDGTLSTSYQYNSFYFFGLDRMESKLTFTISDLESTSDYQFEVQAVDAWGKMSAVLATENKTETMM